MSASDAPLKRKCLEEVYYILLEKPGITCSEATNTIRAEILEFFTEDIEFGPEGFCHGDKVEIWHGRGWEECQRFENIKNYTNGMLISSVTIALDDETGLDHTAFLFGCDGKFWVVDSEPEYDCKEKKELVKSYPKLKWLHSTAGVNPKTEAHPGGNCWTIVVIMMLLCLCDMLRRKDFFDQPVQCIMGYFAQIKEIQKQNEPQSFDNIDENELGKVAARVTWNYICISSKEVNYFCNEQIMQKKYIEVFIYCYCT